MMPAASGPIVSRIWVPSTIPRHPSRSREQRVRDAGVPATLPVAGRRSVVYDRVVLAEPRRRRFFRAWTACGIAGALLLGPGAGWSGTFRVDSERTRLAVRLYREGVGGRLAHDHVVEAAEVTGRVEYDPARPEASAVVIEVSTASLRVDEPAARRRLGVEGDLSDSQRADVAKTMRGPEQLDVLRHPTIRFASTRVVGEGDGRLRVTGELSLRGVTREVSFPATVALEASELRGRATLSFLQSSFGYRPYSAVLGAIRNKDEVTLHVDLVATP
jgi:polyisoprenoid-binding protein YceI